MMPSEHPPDGSDKVDTTRSRAGFTSGLFDTRGGDGKRVARWLTRGFL